MGEGGQINRCTDMASFRLNRLGASSVKIPLFLRLVTCQMESVREIQSVRRELGSAQLDLQYGWVRFSQYHQESVKSKSGINKHFFLNKLAVFVKSILRIKHQQQNGYMSHTKN